MRAAEYVRNFLIGETLPSADDEYALHQRFLPEITLAEINKLAREWFPASPQNRLVIVTAPEKSGLVMPDEPKLAAIFKEVPAAELKPYVDTIGSAVLLESLPAPGKIISAAANDKTGLTTWVLANGVKVVLSEELLRRGVMSLRTVTVENPYVCSVRSCRVAPRIQICAR